MRSGLNCGFKRGEPELTAMRGTPDWIAYALRLPMIARARRALRLLQPQLSSAVGCNFFEHRHLGARVRAQELVRATRYHRRLLARRRPRRHARLGRYSRASAARHGEARLANARDGQWEGRQIFLNAWVDRSVRAHSPANESNDYGLAWWMPHAIRDFFEAVGRGGQRIACCRTGTSWWS